jgi:precorrin-6B methylase 1
MNKRTVMASLNKIANELDNNGLHNEADTVTKVMSRLAYDDERDYMNDKMDDMDLKEFIKDKITDSLYF